LRGIYILLIKVKKPISVRIGALGKLKFEKGLYAYVGSAQNNLEKRILRHKTENKKLRWHIDYLLSNKYVKIVKVFYKKAGKEEECKTARKLSRTEFLIPNFGCSDCKCESHLFKIKNIKNILKLKLKKL